MKFLFASDSFKGSISSEESAAMLTEATHEVFGNEVECINITMADGGEGTAEAIVKAIGGEIIPVSVHGPLHNIIEAHYGAIKLNHAKQADCAIIEMAEASGLTLISEKERNPLYTTTYGTGELIKDALNRGYRELYITLGGSATNDGGTGCLRALGVKFLDKDGKELQGRGCDLIHISKIDASGIDKRLSNCHITAMCDVKNQLCGPQGATYTFGSQKGADSEMQKQLEAGMRNYRDRLINTFGINPDNMPGSGAAGGMGAALMVFLNAQLKSGIETVLELTDFDNKAKDATLVVTGEGCTDWQSAQGKVLYGIGTHCQRLGIPTVALVGGLGKGADVIYQHGIASIYTTIAAPMTLQQALVNAHEYYKLAAIRMFRLIKLGMSIGEDNKKGPLIERTLGVAPTGLEPVYPA